MRARSACNAIDSISSPARRTRRSRSVPEDSIHAVVLVDRLHQLVDALAAGRDGLDHRRSPQPGLAAVAEADHVADVADGGVGAVAVGLVDDEDVADLEDPGLGGLDAVAHAGGQQHDGRVGQARRPRPRTGRPRRSRRGRRRTRPRRAPAAPAASSTTARRGARGWPSTGCRPRGRARGPASGPGHRAARRRRTARTGRRRARRPAGPGARSAPTSGAGRGRLADPRAAGEADDVRPAGVRRERRHHLAQGGVGVLDQRDQPRDGARRRPPGPARRGRGRRRTAAPWVGLLRAGSRSGAGHADDEGVALAAAAAQRGRADAAAATLELERQVQGDPGAGHADRVAERDRAAVDVDLVGVDAQLPGRGQADRGERLVDLDQVEVGGRDALLLRRPSRWRGPAGSAASSRGRRPRRARRSRPARSGPAPRPWPCS